MSYIEKINHLIESDINRNDIDYILDFVLLWNLFELQFFWKNCTSSKINSFNKKINTIEIDINKYFIYFKDRYSSVDKFDSLNFNHTQKEIIRDNLDKEDNKIITILHIIYRFRNNLFHWEKKIEFIEDQKENFEYANAFLYDMLELDIKNKKKT